MGYDLGSYHLSPEAAYVVAAAPLGPMPRRQEPGQLWRAVHGAGWY